MREYHWWQDRIVVAALAAYGMAGFMVLTFIYIRLFVVTSNAFDPMRSTSLDCLYGALIFLFAGIAILQVNR